MKKSYSLFIGRYQPWHDGHKKLVEKVLDEGKNVCIAVRNTEITESDPYSFVDRWTMIHKSMEKYMKQGKLVIIRIPDIEEICWGRKVGWGRREIHLDEETEAISATKLRNGEA